MGFRPAVVILMLVACGDNGGNTPPADSTPADSSSPDSAVCVPDTGPATVIYLNRTGGTYTSGTDDSSTNVSGVIDVNMSPKTIAAPTIVEADWTEVRACLDDKFAPFNVSFTETDPGAAEHQEVVMLENAAAIGQSNGVLALSPVKGCETGTTNPVPVLRGVTYVMWGTFGNNPQANTGRCEVTAQAIAATYGLDHAFSCPDLMTFLSGCGAKSFTDEDVQCGEDTARLCRCGGATQNSFKYLSELLGSTCEP